MQKADLHISRCKILGHRIFWINHLCFDVCDNGNKIWLDISGTVNIFRDAQVNFSCCCCCWVFSSSMTDLFMFHVCLFFGIWFFQHVEFQFEVFYSSNTCLLVGYTSCCGGWLENCPSKWNVFPPQCTMQLPYLDRHFYLYVNTGKYSYAYIQYVHGYSSTLH